MLVFIYVVFYLFAIYCEQKEWKNKRYVLIASCITLVVLAGTRDIHFWPDTEVYVANFEYYTNNLFQFSFDDTPLGFTEPFFYYVGVIAKTFSNNYVFYLLFVAAVSFFFLYKDLRQYCVYPLFGLCVYVSRFLLGRNFIQIRAGISYAILILGVKYITKRDWKRYFLIVLIAYLFHRSALIGVPLYFLCLFRWKKKHIVMAIVLAFIIGGFFSNTLQNFIIDNASDLTIEKYTMGEELSLAKGLRNPLIYFQVVILMLYTLGEKRLSHYNPYYYTIRTAYMYSTFILISFCMFLGLSGRTSSLFATLEIVIIPSIVLMFNKRNRFLAYIGMGAALTAIFYMNYFGH